MPSFSRDVIPMTSSESQPGQETKVGLQWARLKRHWRLLQKWWLLPHRPFQPVFVVASYRSGSNLLLSYLNQQPNVVVLSEVLSSRLDIGPSRDQISPAKALGHIRFCLQGERTAIRGCKLMLQQLRTCNLTLDDLNREFPTAKYIVLYRESLAEQYTSHIAAEATGEYLVRRGQLPQQAQVKVDPQELRTYCDQTRRQYCDALNSGWLADRAVLLSYEELVADPKHWMRDHICPLLSVPFARLETKLVKQNRRLLREQVVNYSEVASLLESPLCRQQHSLRRTMASRAVA